MQQAPNVELSSNNDADEIDLLDLLLVLAENLKLLVGGAVLSALLAFSGASFWPKTFEATAIVASEQVFATLLKSAPVIDAVAALPAGKAVLQPSDDSNQEQRGALRSRIGATFSAKDKTVTLTARAKDPDQARQLAQAVLEQAFLKSQPRGAERERLEQQLAQAKMRQAEAAKGAAGLARQIESGRGSTFDVAQGYAQLLRALEAGEQTISTLENKLAGVNSSDLLQAPASAQHAVAPKRALVTVVGGLAGGFALLLFVFVRQALRRAAHDPESAAKLARIRQALGLR